MDIKIGVQNVSREIALESDESADEVAAKVAKAVEGATLDLVDNKGRRVIVPAGALAYVDIGTEERRRVGFGG